MPYKIVNVDEGYKVCKKDNNKCFSKEPLTLENAEAQLKAIGINSHLEGGAKPINQELYNKIKDEVYKKYPKHSLFRSALIVKKYLKEGGKYEGKENQMNIKKWFKQNWISANDYLRDKTVKCGEANTQEDYNEYPLCRPKAILDKLTKPEIKKMVDEKNKIGKKQLKTKDILGTEKYNIKPTITGTGKNDLKEYFSKNKKIKNDDISFEKQLNEIGLTPEDYLNLVKTVAKHRNYNPELIKISDDGIHKLNYDGIKFGRVGYRDKIIYYWLEKIGKIPKGTAKEKYINYRKRAKDVMIKTKNKYSPASLSYNIIWIVSFIAMIF